ncbi:MAG: hypothetical protein V3S39_09785 [Thermodesulfobacteriota bacterium]
MFGYSKELWEFGIHPECGIYPHVEQVRTEQRGYTICTNDRGKYEICEMLAIVSPDTYEGLVRRLGDKLALDQKVYDRSATPGLLYLIRLVMEKRR